MTPDPPRRERRKALRVALAAIALIALGLGAWRLAVLYQHYRQLTEQLPTFANLQVVAAQIQRQLESNPGLSDNEVRTMVRGFFGEFRDAWGDEIIYVRKNRQDISFLLISPGADGKLDVKDPAIYFLVPRTEIIGQLDRDIVFRDGVAVTNGGKR